MLLNLALIHQQEVAIHLFHNFIPHNVSPKVLKVDKWKNLFFLSLEQSYPRGCSAREGPSVQSVHNGQFSTFANT